MPEVIKSTDIVGEFSPQMSLVYLTALTVILAWLNKASHGHRRTCIDEKSDVNRFLHSTSKTFW